MKLFAERLLRPGKELLKSAKNDILDSDPATLEHQAFNSSGTDARQQEVSNVLTRVKHMTGRRLA